MPWNPNIPQAGNKLRNSQLDLLNNNMAIDAGFSLNHVDLNLAAAGQHTHLTMQLQAASPVTAASTQEFYNFVNVDTGFNELYIKKNVADVQAGKTLLDVPFTASVLSGVIGTSFGSGGWTYLPSGLLVQWGSATSPNHATAAVANLTKNFQFNASYVSIYSANYNGVNAVPIVQRTGQTVNSITWTWRGSTPTVASNQWTVNFIAIGV